MWKWLKALWDPSPQQRSEARDWPGEFQAQRAPARGFASAEPHPEPEFAEPDPAVEEPNLQEFAAEEATFEESAVTQAKPAAQTFRVRFDGTPLQDAVAGKGIVAVSKTIETGETVLQLSGGVPNAMSAGRTDGYSIRVPDEFEVAASGQKIRVSAIVRAPNAEGAEFSLAYSTNDVGNSGWRKFTAEAGFSTFGFEWHVPPMQHGNGDFVGVLPPSGAVPIEVREVEVWIAE